MHKKLIESHRLIFNLKADKDFSRCSSSATTAASSKACRCQGERLPLISTGLAPQPAGDASPRHPKLPGVVMVGLVFFLVAFTIWRMAFILKTHVCFTRNKAKTALHPVVLLGSGCPRHWEKQGMAPHRIPFPWKLQYYGKCQGRKCYSALSL